VTYGRTLGSLQRVVQELWSGGGGMQIEAVDQSESHFDFNVTHSLPWHPRLSERLGLFRLVECNGSHEMFFSNPQELAEAIDKAGRD
jgi:hypothetical protein